MVGMSSSYLQIVACADFYFDFLTPLKACLFDHPRFFMLSFFLYCLSTTPKVRFYSKIVDFAVGYPLTLVNR